jgi:hypothetical protein
MDTMARRTLLAIATLCVLGAAAAARPAAADSSIGFGVHAWRTVDDLESDGFSGIRRDGISYLLSYQYKPGGLLKFELDGEYFPTGFGGSTHYAVSPQGYVLLGGLIYGGVGIGTIFSRDFSNDMSSPYYIARVGVDLHLLPKLDLDVNANYQFKTFNELHGVSTGTVTLGAIARFNL